VPAADGVPAYWQSYTNRLEEADDAAGIPQELDVALQAYVDSGGTLEAGDVEGTYVYTYGTDPANVTTPVPVAYEPSLTHRVGFEYRLDGNINPDNPFFDFVPDGSAGSGAREIVTDDRAVTPATSGWRCTARAVSTRVTATPVTIRARATRTRARWWTCLTWHTRSTRPISVRLRPARPSAVSISTGMESARMSSVQ
jgi:hypothetical protein